MSIKNYLKENWQIILLFTLAAVTRFSFLSYPSEVVFDEVHFGKFVSSYFTHEYYFDIHPPLGKMMIAGFAKISGFDLNGENPKEIFSQIGGQVNSRNIFVLRFLPAFFGAIFVILIYKLILMMGLSKKAAFLGSFLILFDNAFLVQSKFIFLDIFLIFFGFSAIYFFMLSRKYDSSSGKNAIFLIISAVFSVLALSIKWTGLSFLGIIILWIIIDFLTDFKIKQALKKILIFTLIPFLIYFLIFFIHFKILYKSGADDSYMSPAFQKTLSGNNLKPEVKNLSYWQKFIELNSAMYRYNKNITAKHPYSSKWYQWVAGKKPIWYWTHSTNSGQTDEKTASIYLLGNPLIWWPVFLSVISAFLLLLKKRWRRSTPPVIYLLSFGYWINLLPFIFISRVAFLYHYLPSFTFGILIFSLLWNKIIYKPAAIEKPYKLKKQKIPQKIGFLTFPSKPRFLLYSVYLLIVLSMFLFLSPLSYGFPLSREAGSVYKIFVSF